MAATKGAPKMGIRDLFEGSHALILILVIVALFGWKRLPDAARGLGRSMRILKSEMSQMSSDGKDTASTPSDRPAAGETVPHTPQQAPDPNQPPA
jgi:sec-independent protein translocase protein TatA